jgi:hypothetical protein
LLRTYYGEFYTPCDDCDLYLLWLGGTLCTAMTMLLLNYIGLYGVQRFFHCQDCKFACYLTMLPSLGMHFHLIIALQFLKVFLGLDVFALWFIYWCVSLAYYYSTFLYWMCFIALIFFSCNFSILGQHSLPMYLPIFPWDWTSLLNYLWSMLNVLYLCIPVF